MIEGRWAADERVERGGPEFVHTTSSMMIVISRLWHAEKPKEFVAEPPRMLLF
ncbi:MAG: hypothetical protein Q9181_000485 [Wetmoreana brouardii]